MTEYVKNTVERELASLNSKKEKYEQVIQSLRAQITMNGADLVFVESKIKELKEFLGGTDGRLE